MIANTIDPKELKEQYRKITEFCALYGMKDPFLEFYDFYFSNYLTELGNLLDIVENINETGKVLSEKLPKGFGTDIEKPLIERVYAMQNKELFQTLICQSETLLEESRKKLKEYDKVLRQAFDV